MRSPCAFPGDDADDGDMVTRTQHDLEKASAIALEAMELNISVTGTIGAVMNLRETQARNLLRRLKDQGFLGARPHLPTKATIHRNTAKERNFLVCEHCLIGWPCAEAFPYRDKPSLDDPAPDTEPRDT